MTVTPTAEQAQAIKAIVAWYRDPGARQEFYLAGYAGVGKSTVAAIAIEELRSRCKVKTVRTGAYTGKAALVMRRKGVQGAQTIHSMIYRPVDDGHGHTKFEIAWDGPASDADLIVLDECSMVDEEMARHVRGFGKKILVMGDPGQLPPVRGAGAFTSREPDFFLREIHRQAADSPIIRLATMARKGEPIPAGDYGSDVRVLPIDKETQTEVYREDTQAICGLHRVRWVYTQRIRRRRGFDGPMPIMGERVMCCRNNKELAIFNGSLGIVTESAANAAGAPGCFALRVAMEDSRYSLPEMPVHPYLFQQHFAGPVDRPRIQPHIQEFDWGYVLTAHKAQGSEWPHVTIVDDSGAFREERHRWLYTAVTRASSGLTLLQRGA